MTKYDSVFFDNLWIIDKSPSGCGVSGRNGHIHRPDFHDFYGSQSLWPAYLAELSMQLVDSNQKLNHVEPKPKHMFYHFLFPPKPPNLPTSPHHSQPSKTQVPPAFRGAGACCHPNLCPWPPLQRNGWQILGAPPSTEGVHEGVGGAVVASSEESSLLKTMEKCSVWSEISHFP